VVYGCEFDGAGGEALIERKLDKMIRLNASRYDFLDRFQKMRKEAAFTPRRLARAQPS